MCETARLAQAGIGGRYAVHDVAQIVRPGIVAIVPSNTRHSVRALTDGRVIIVDHPARPEFD